MTAEDVRKVSVIGAGLMGHGIAQEFALAGYEVGLNDLNADVLNLAVDRIRGNLGMLAEKGLIQAGGDERALDRIRTSEKIEESVEDADVVVEAMAENLEAKRTVFERLDEVCPGRTILATNSSSFVPGKLAGVTGRPDKVVGAHYFNPPFLIPLVEIIRSPDTSDETVDLMFDLMVEVGKSPVIVQKEVPGFIANRLQAALMREALALVADGVASAQDVDRVMRTSIGRRWAVAGVFEVTEIAGLDLKRAILTELLPSLATFAEVPDILVEKVERGELGIKTGKGFYDWTKESARELRERIAVALIEIERWRHDSDA